MISHSFRRTAFPHQSALLAAVLTARGLRADRRSPLVAVSAGAAIAYLVSASLMPGHVTFAQLFFDAPAIRIITDGVFFLTATLVGAALAVWRHRRA